MTDETVVDLAAFKTNKHNKHQETSLLSEAPSKPIEQHTWFLEYGLSGGEEHTEIITGKLGINPMFCYITDESDDVLKMIPLTALLGVTRVLPEDMIYDDEDGEVA